MRLSLALIASAALALGLPANAQDAASAREDAQVLWAFATCAVERDQWRVEAMLAETDSDKRRDKLAQIADRNGTCILSASPSGGRLRVRGSQLARNALAAALVDREYRQRPLPAFEAVGQIYSLASLQEDASENRQLRMGANQFAECVARRSPQEVLGLLRSEPFSADENETIAQLQPVMSQCLPVAEAASLGFTRLDLRTTIGMVLYRLSAEAEELGAARLAAGGAQ